MLSKTSFALLLRNFVFGVEDSLVSTVGLLSGIAIAGVEQKTILLTGSVLIIVEAFSMAIGSFLAERSAEDYIKQAEVPMRRSLAGGLVMFLSYLLSGLIPLMPYAFMETELALQTSVALSLLALFALGIASAKISNIKILANGFSMMIIGGVAIVVGILAGEIMK